MDHFCYFCANVRVSRLFIDAMWSHAGKDLTLWFLFVMSHCVVVTFLLVSWVRCGARLYCFLIFAIFLSLNVGASVKLRPSQQ